MDCKTMLNKRPSSASITKFSFWCTVILDGKQIRVRVRHLERGKFQIIEDEAEISSQSD